MAALPRWRDAHRVPFRRRRRIGGGVLFLAGAMAIATTALAAEEFPGRVMAAGATASLEVDVITTKCGAVCSGVAGAAACIGLTMDQATCQASRQMNGITCQSMTPTATALCLAPADATRWTLLLTNDAERLALAHSGVSFVDDAELQKAIVLNASEVTSIKSFELPATTTQLTIRSAPGEEQRLPLALSSEVITGWKSLDRLVLQNLDLSAVTALPAFPSLGVLDVSHCRLNTWAVGATPKLSNLDVSSNELTSLPKGSLPVSLKVLNVSSNNLVEFPVDIASLPSLSVLSVSNNNLASLTQFPKLSALTELYLSACRLTTVPAGIANLPALQVLDMSNNNFATAMENFPASLRSLKLRSCSMKRVPGDFGIEKIWEFVDLSENPFSENAFDGVKFRANTLILDQVQLTSISPNIKAWSISNKLSLSRNALGAVDADALPRDVTELHLANCSLTEVPPNLPSLQRLSILDLSKNRLGSVFKNSFPKTLTELYLSGCQLGKVPLDVDAMKATLQKLDLSGNNLTNVTLQGFTGLLELNLRNNSLTSIPASVFTMANLTSLDLRGNPIRNVRLTDAQFKFLSQLRTFEIDPAAFAFTGTCVESVILRGKYKVCKNVVGSKTPVPGNSSNSTSPTPQPSSTASGKTSSSTVLNIILGCAVALVMIISVFVSRMPSRRSTLAGEAYGAMDSASASRYGPLDMWDDPELLQWRVDILDVELVMQIGIGAHSVLWLARYKLDTVVAKRLYYKRTDPRAFETFVEEVKFLGRLVHENIVQFYGVSWTCESDLQMLLEFMANGDLHKHLTTTRADESARSWSARKVRIAMDIARALTYLHAHHPALLHRDLRSHHVLLDENYTAKLTDFGMCRERVEDLDLLAVGGNTSRSIAPEVLSGRGAHGRAVDMYAFGVILAELDSHELPFSDITLSSGAALSEVAMLELLSTGALQPSISPDCPQDIALLILDCLTFDANRRPTAALALQRLQVVLDSFDALGSGHDDSARRRAGSYLDEKEDDDDDDTAAYTI